MNHQNIWLLALVLTLLWAESGYSQTVEPFPPSIEANLVVAEDAFHTLELTYSPSELKRSDLVSGLILIVGVPGNRYDRTYLATDAPSESVTRSLTAGIGVKAEIVWPLASWIHLKAGGSVAGVVISETQKMAVQWVDEAQSTFPASADYVTETELTMYAILRPMIGFDFLLNRHLAMTARFGGLIGPTFDGDYVGDRYRSLGSLGLQLTY